MKAFMFGIVAEMSDTRSMHCCWIRTSVMEYNGSAEVGYSLRRTKWMAEKTMTGSRNENAMTTCTFFLIDS
jgi:hypothetical protein